MQLSRNQGKAIFTHSLNTPFFGQSSIRFVWVTNYVDVSPTDISQLHSALHQFSRLCYSRCDMVHLYSHKHKERLTYHRLSLNANLRTCVFVINPLCVMFTPLQMFRMFVMRLALALFQGGDRLLTSESDVRSRSPH